MSDPFIVKALYQRREGTQHTTISTIYLQIFFHFPCTQQNSFLIYFPFQSDDSASFLRAARGGNSEKVLEYLKNGIDINTCNAVSRNDYHGL